MYYQNNLVEFINNDKLLIEDKSNKSNKFEIDSITTHLKLLDIN